MADTTKAYESLTVRDVNYSNKRKINYEDRHYREILLVNFFMDKSADRRNKDDHIMGLEIAKYDMQNAIMEDYSFLINESKASRSAFKIIEKFRGELIPSLSFANEIDISAHLKDNMDSKLIPWSTWYGDGRGYAACFGSAYPFTKDYVNLSLMSAMMMKFGKTPSLMEAIRDLCIEKSNNGVIYDYANILKALIK